MTVVVVESPAKAKTINKYLGSRYTVLASYGHVRDLPAKDGSVRPDDDFSMSWELDSRAAKRMNAIAEAVKSADKLILATDPDREGEAISWHVLEILRRKGALNAKTIERVVFNAVTRQAVLEAMQHPRQIDGDLVEAYLARRALDYLVGFTLSPVLWRKLPGARSAGRVQSVALRLICDRELEIESFRSQEFWTVEAGLRTAGGERFEARLTAIEGRKLGKFDVPSEARAREIERALDGGVFTVEAVDSKPAKRHPQPPFITSTLQQEASRKLGLSSSRTMQVAQKLYEGIDIGGETVGLITYMRTDGVQMAGEAMAATRNAILEKFGEPYLPSAPRVYRSKAKNAQEAHEAIRPTDLFRFPERVRRHLNAEEAALYDLIWKRTVASQMESAEFERTTIDIATVGNDARRYAFRATGAVQRFDGFLRLYQEGRDDEADEDGRRLPAMARGDRLGVERIVSTQHFTEPPPRYSEASLIKKLEELGIGRPSTYTAILVVLRERGYVRIDNKKLVPEDKGRLVTAFLEAFFRRYVEYDFTANLEEQLDRISAGEIAWKSVLRDFWRDFIAAVEEIKDLRVSAVLDALNDLLEPHIFPPREDGAPPRQCPACETGQLSLKIGRYGAFIGCSNYPDCRFTRQLGNGEEGTKDGIPTEGIVLGNDPASGVPVTMQTGRFGPYVQRGTGEDGKPERSSLPKGVAPEEVDLAFALRLLSLPREIGLHPETGKPITAGLGRYGPFVQHDGRFANLESFEEVFSVGLNRAVDVLASKAKGGRAAPAVLRELGPHPDGGGPVQIMSGRYGPYVKYAKVNATLPKGVSPESVTLDQAVALVADKKAKGKSAPARARKPAKATSEAGAKAKPSKAKATAKAKAKAKK